MLCALLGGFWALALFCLVEGAAAVFATIGTTAIIDDAMPGQRGRVLAAYQSAALIGAAVGPAIGGLVGDRWGLRAPFLLYAGLAAFAAGWLYWHLERHFVAEQAQPGAHASSVRRPVRRVLADHRLVAVPLLGAWRLGLAPRQIGLALSLSGIAAYGAFYPAGWLADRYGHKSVVVPGGLGMVGALALFALSGSYTAFIGSALLLGAGSGLIGPAPTAYLADMVAAEDRATSVGVYRTLGDLGAAVAPPLLGWISDRSGYGSAIFVAAAVLLIAVLAFVWLAPAAPSAREAAPQALHEAKH